MTPPTSDVRNFYEGDAQRYDERWTTPGGRLNWRRQHRVVNALTADWRSASVLEIGPGTGRFSRILVGREGTRLTLADIATGMLAATRASLREGDVSNDRWRAVNCSITDLPFARGSFDAVLCVNVLNHVRNRDRAIQELLRVTRQGGEVLVTFMNRRSVYWLAAKRVDKLGNRAIGQDVYSRWDDPHSVEQVLLPFGTSIKARRGHVHVPRQLPGRALTMLVGLGDLLLRRGPLRRFAPTQFVLAQRELSSPVTRHTTIRRSESSR